MYYPEANVLVPTATDPGSKTPAFKSVQVTLEPEGLPEGNTLATSAQANGVAGRVPLNVLQA
jgi:hypothetical protein